MRNGADMARQPEMADWIQQAVMAAGDLFYDWDLTTDNIVWAGQGAQIFGEDPEPLKRGERFLQRVNPEDIPLRLKSLSAHVSDNAPYDCEYRIRSDNGAFVWVHDRGSVIRAGNGMPQRLVGSLRLITARKNHEARLERMASFDELTGHLNHVRLREALDHAIEYNRRAEIPGAYLVIGVDKLSVINNTLGPEAGDAVLLAVGQRLDRVLRASDVIGRIGGDRFGVILGQCSEGQMARAAERILMSVREHPVQAGDAETHVSVSIGGVLFSELSTTAVDVMAKGETALKQAKMLGRDRFIPYQMSVRQGEVHRQNLIIGNQVKQALRDHRLQFAFQPVVNTDNHEAVFYECLLRMRDEQGQIVPAGVFVPVIEQLGLVRMVDRHVLDLALEFLTENPHLQLAINISGLTASDQSWLRRMSALLKGRPEVAKRLIVEVTETSALIDIEESARFLQTIRDLGCRVAVDDFGAGYTSFRHLKALTLDIVKIDGSFVKNLAGNVDNQLFIRNLLGLADTYGMETVAECVETQEDARFLIGEGVKYLQGYYYGKPSLQTPLPSDRHIVVSAGAFGNNC